ncbi:MAG TPA: TIGR02270 family protein [Rhizobacter sp.]|nr:TIGR02270 family protein [Rhizobacter sp.]
MGAIVAQHLEDAAALRGVRSVLVRAPHVRLHQLGRTDERLAAHLDGLAESGDAAGTMATAALADPDRNTLFVAAVLAITRQDAQALDKLLSIAEALPALRSGLVSAFGWVPAASLRGITKPLLDSAQAFRRGIGLASCAPHLVSPGSALDEALADPAVQWQAVRLAARLGDPTRLGVCLDLLKSPDPLVQAEAARAALLLGNRDQAVEALAGLARKPGSLRHGAQSLVAKVLHPADARALLRPLAQTPADARLLIHGAAVAGDPHYVPWLIKQMADRKLTRLAGEAFSMITGLDLAYLDMDTKPPIDGDTAGPSDDPADDNVALDDDESLPWPDAAKIAAWWQQNGARFQQGSRYFIGAPPTPQHCLSVLNGGFQRQRIAAAEYLCLLQPGTPLFNVAAPASRQQRLLSQMGA